MSTITLVVILLALAILGALALAGRSAKKFVEEKKRKHHQPIVRMPPPGRHARRKK